ncbi:N-acetylneuraminate epimerase [Planctomycetes bacterium CA13]|uniref:N-acetylneuraminate epimerase n=1 Tax=Novipirellula herctigrandis TaxID=2527986 RepID=A0A5C5Z848_9BACT|nr:N-acetylneuraminate epimerase [Planctomycetes bacterium CA13]
MSSEERSNNLAFVAAVFFVVACFGSMVVNADQGQSLAPAEAMTHWQWKTVDTMGEPTGRHETSLVRLGGKFYLIGGRESRQVDRFDPLSSTWDKMSVTTPLIHHFQPVVWDDKIYMVGAMTGNYPTEPPMDRVQIYDPVKDVWSEGDAIPKLRRRGGAGTAVYNGKIYIACGITDGHTRGTNNWFDEYDPATGVWTKLPDAPHIRDHFHAVVLDDKFYCIGGRNTSLHKPTFGAFFGAVETAVDIYDFKTKSWSTLNQAPLPVGTAAAGVAVIDDRIVYFGGETAETAVPMTWILDPTEPKWTRLANLQQGRHGSQAVVYDGRIYIAAGSPKRGGGKLRSIEVFSEPSEGSRP